MMSDHPSTGVGEADRLLGDLFGGAVQDPFPLYDELRELGNGVHHVAAMDAVLVTRYDDAKRVGLDAKTFSSDVFATTAPGIHDPSDPEHRRFAETAGRLFMFADPPRHTRVRSAVRYAFTPGAAGSWRSTVERVTDEVLALFTKGQEIDIMPHLAADVPVAVIARILGVPADQWHNFRDWSFGYASTFDPMVQGERRNEAIRISLTLFDYLSTLIADRAREPADDLVSHLIDAETFDGERLTGQDLVAQLALLLIAGNETTTNLIGNGVTLLLDHPDARRLLAKEPALLPGAIEEMLRFDPPLHLAGRKTTAEVSFGRHIVAPETLVLVCLPAANRDPRAFPDAARFDIRRTDNRHLAFSCGIHYCLGAALARLEAKIIFERLLAKFPDVRAGGAPAVRRTLNVVSRGWQARPVLL